jgi:hypothetical protein
MFRRIGYILGLLFVLACVAAYPLTWGRVVVARSVGSGWAHQLSVGHGRLHVTRFEPVSYADGLVTYTFPSAILGGGRYLPTFRSDFYDFTGSYDATCPLWMPALATSLFMAWRWRRRRTRRGAGFPVAEKSQGTGG